MTAETWADVGDELSVAAEELQVADEELRTQHELIEKLVGGRLAGQLAGARLAAAVPVPLMSTDSAGTIAEANGAVATLLQVPARDLCGKPIFAFIDPTDRRAVRSALARVTTSGQPRHLAARVTPRGGAAVLADIAVVPSLGRPDGDAPPDGAHPSGADSGPRSTRARTVRWVLSPGTASGNVVDVGLLDALTELSTTPTMGVDMRATLDRVVRLALRWIPAARAASVIVGSPLEPALVVSTDALAQALDGAQLRAAEGPACEAYETDAPVTTSAVQADPRWPRLAGAVPPSGGAALAVPVPDSGRAMGVLILYGEPALTGAGPRTRAALFAGAAAGLLREDHAVAELRRLQHQLGEALASRAMIDQAKGILMARLHIDADAAYAELVRRSQHSNIKLREVARQLVADITRFAEPAR